MKSLISIYTDENFVRSLEVACKSLQYRKASCIDMIEKFEKNKKRDDDPLDDDLISMYKEKISEVEDAYDQLFEMYVSLCGCL